MPKALDNAMHLYTLSLSPYTFSEEEIEIEQVDNRRYTMKDLRGIDERLKNAEYYSSLNALEASVKNKQLFNGSGFDRFKNGFFVENFDGHNLSDSTKKGYRASIDRNKNKANYAKCDLNRFLN